MVTVAQLVRAPGCGPGGRGFNSPRSPRRRQPVMYPPRSSRGLGRRPFTPVTRVQIPYAVPSTPRSLHAPIPAQGSGRVVPPCAVDTLPLRCAHSGGNAGVRRGSRSAEWTIQVEAGTAGFKARANQRHRRPRNRASGTTAGWKAMGQANSQPTGTSSASPAAA